MHGCRIVVQLLHGDRCNRAHAGAGSTAAASRRVERRARYAWAEADRVFRTDLAAALAGDSLRGEAILANCGTPWPRLQRQRQQRTRLACGDAFTTKRAFAALPVTLGEPGFGAYQEVCGASGNAIVAAATAIQKQRFIDCAGRSHKHQRRCSAQQCAAGSVGLGCNSRHRYIPGGPRIICEIQMAKPYPDTISTDKTGTSTTVSNKNTRSSMPRLDSDCELGIAWPSNEPE
jgi:hypothetical protein